MVGFQFVTSVLSIFFFTVASCFSLDHDPYTIQLDLIFPRNNSVYKPVYPFPIVFAVHNASKAWTHQLQLIWRITGFENNFKYGRGDAYSIRKDPPNSDQFLIINSTAGFLNTTKTTFMLRTSFGIRYNCSADDPMYNNRSRQLDFFYDNFVTFNVSDHGETPDIMAAGACPAVMGTIGVVGNATNPLNGAKCLVLTDHPPQGESCAIKVDSEVASRVESEMLATVSCTNGIWPDVPWFYMPCDNNAMRSSSFGLGITVFLAAVMGFGLVLW